MKRFFAMVLLVTTFFIGLGSLVDHAGAKFKSDAKALELIRQARIAIGGDVSINNIRSMMIAGNSTHFFGKDGVRQSEQGTLEINLQLLNQFSKMVRIGNSDGNGGDKKIIIKRNDGTVQEIKSGDAKTFVFKKGDGNVNRTSDDRKNIVIEKDVKIETISGERNKELFRTTLALLLTAPQGLDVSYTFAGEENIDGNSCNIVEAQTGGSSFKLFLDKSTFLPRMISYQGTELPHIVEFKKDDLNNISKEEIIELKVGAGNIKTIEHQLEFSDFRSVGGLLLPYRWIRNRRRKTNAKYRHHKL